MKTTEKILRLYIDKFINGSIEFEGLTLVPELNEYGVIEWSVNNPNNLSYTFNTVQQQIEDSLLDFEKLMGYGGRPYIESRQSIRSYNSFDFDENITEELYKKLYNESLKTIIDIHLPAFRKDEGFYSENCKVGLYHLNFNGESIDMVFNIYLTENVINSKTNEIIPDDEVADRVYDSIQLDYGHNGEFIDSIYNSLDNVTKIITDDKRLYDFYTSYIDIAIRIFYKGNKIY